MFKHCRTHAVVTAALLLSLLCGCAHFDSKAGTTLNERASALMDDRRFAEAIELLGEAYAASPDEPGIGYLLGVCHYRMQQYDKSVEYFEKTATDDPDIYDSLQMLWASRLEAARASGTLGQAEEETRKDIERTLSLCDESPGSLLAAYIGYGYLKDRTSAVGAIKRLAIEAKDEGLREFAAKGLAEEIIMENNDRRAKVELSVLFLSAFPDHGWADIAAWSLFSTLSEQYEDDEEGFVFSVDGYLDALEETPSLNLAAAYHLVKRGLDIEKAVSLINRGLAKEEMRHEGESKTRRHITASFYKVLGWAYFKLGMPEESETYLMKSAAIRNGDELVNNLLGKIRLAQGIKEEAAEAFRRALETGDSEEDSYGLLKGIMLEIYGVDGPPEEFFARKEWAPYFEDATEASGLSGIGAIRASWGDIDNDGLDDLLLSGPRLFRNTGGGKFTEITAEAFGGLRGFSGGAFGDYDNDGHLDLYLISHGKDALLRNNRSGGFVDVTEEAMRALQAGPGEAAAWGDMDGDGLLDLYVANYELPAVEGAVCEKDRLWRNKGDGTFEEVSAGWGVTSDEPMCGRGVVWGDFNNDGMSDILVSNYRLDPNFLWMNLGARFEDAAGEKGARGYGVDGYFGHTVGSAFGDLDNDGDLDIVSGNIAHPRYMEFSDRTKVLINSGSPDYVFEDSSEDSGVSFAETHSEPNLADFDNDGDLDLYLTSVYPERNSFLYLNDGNGRFRDVTWLSGTRVKNGWGSAVSDIDNDGDLDIIVASSEGVRLFKNSGNPNNWVSIRLRSGDCQSTGVGSRVRMEYGGIAQVREAQAGGGTGTQNSGAVHFGAGGHGQSVDIEVRNACGSVVRLNTAPNKIILVDN